ncbi:MAG: helix-turn-helix domain-containing protein [Thermodesulfovibrio sp.]|nr:TetR/AcrR family transcriptional regulator [Thermodesulfovibrio sp.]MDW7998492.1 helix-turn-helix domain-containing protein [Thermodesulfovibrio sp.]
MLVITTMTDTKKKILKSALRLFSQKGYLGTTTKEIAKEAQIAEVTLFRYFNSKERLFIEVLKSQSFLPTLKDLIPKIRQKDYKEALKTVSKYYLNLLKKKKDLICIMHTEIFQYPAQIRAIHSKMIHEVYLVFASYLEELKNNGIIKKDLDCKYASLAYFGMLFNLFIKKELLKRRIDFKRALQTYIEIFYEGTRRT